MGNKANCPKCGEPIYRKFSFYEKLGLLFPINFRRYATFSCKNDCFILRGPRGWGGFLLTLLVSAGLLAIGSVVYEILLCAVLLVIWNISLWLTRSGDKHPILAGIICGLIWIFAAYNQNWAGSNTDKLRWIFFAGIGVGYLVSIIDRMTITPDKLTVIQEKVLPPVENNSFKPNVN